MYIKPNLETVCKLQFEKAVEVIAHTETVMYKHGVWNPYELRKTGDVIQSIRRSGYGADVSINKDTGVYYVSIPSDGDMW